MEARILRILAGTLLLAVYNAQAADYTWDGSTDTWGSSHWNPGSVPGPTTAGNTATISVGTVSFSQHDTFGNASTGDSPDITLNSGGTLSSGGNWFNTIWNLNLNGGTLSADGGHATWGAFALGGTVTVGGSSASLISTDGGANSRVDLRNDGTAFDVADVTGSSATDLTINTILANGPNVPWTSGRLIKRGVGTLTLTGDSTYTGRTDVEAGTLTVNGGSLSGPGLIDIGATGGPDANFALVDGSVTAGSQFVVGAHGVDSLATMDAGLLQVNGTLYLGGYAEGTGTGTFTQSGGTNTVTGSVQFGGNGPNNGVYNLGGGVLVTPAITKLGTGTATFNFNGGTLKPSTSGAFMYGLTAANVNTDSTIDTAGFDITIAQALLVGSGGGLTKTGTGTLTLSGANTFTGNLVVDNGTITDSRQVNTSTPTATGLGNMMTEGRQIQVNTNGTLLFTAHDPLGAATYYSPVDIIVNGGTVSHGTKFVTVGDVVLQNGGELTGGNGVNGSYQTFNVLGSVTVSGSSASVITSTGGSYIGVHLANGSFVVNETGDDVDLTVDVPLIDKAGGGGAGSLTKSGAGTMRMTAVNTFSGDVTVSGGTLSITQDDTIADAADVLIGAGAKLDLDGAINDTVNRLYLGGVLMKAAPGAQPAAAHPTRTTPTSPAPVSSRLPRAPREHCSSFVNRMGAARLRG